MFATPYFPYWVIFAVAQLIQYSVILSPLLHLCAPTYRLSVSEQV